MWCLKVFLSLWRELTCLGKQFQGLGIQFWYSWAGARHSDKRAALRCILFDLCKRSPRAVSLVCFKCCIYCLLLEKKHRASVHWVSCFERQAPSRWPRSPWVFFLLQRLVWVWLPSSTRTSPPTAALQVNSSDFLVLPLCRQQALRSSTPQWLLNGSWTSEGTNPWAFVIVSGKPETPWEQRHMCVWLAHCCLPIA